MTRSKGLYVQPHTFTRSTCGSQGIARHGISNFPLPSLRANPVQYFLQFFLSRTFACFRENGTSLRYFDPGSSAPLRFASKPVLQCPWLEVFLDTRRMSGTMGGGWVSARSNPPPLTANCAPERNQMHDPKPMPCWRKLSSTRKPELNVDGIARSSNFAKRLGLRCNSGSIPVERRALLGMASAELHHTRIENRCRNSAEIVQKRSKIQDPKPQPLPSCAILSHLTNPMKKMTKSGTQW
jgi:hypothetical protein